MSNSDGPTIVRDLDAEILLRHFCLETEAELVVNWCSKHSARSATDPNERITRALELKEKGNLALKGSKYDVALHLYMAALHHLDFSESARKKLQNAADAKKLTEAILIVLLNLSLVFLKRNDFYNTDRAATLGLWYADKGRSSDDEQENARAKLLYRRGLARFKGAPGVMSLKVATDGADDSNDSTSNSGWAGLEEARGDLVLSCSLIDSLIAKEDGGAMPAAVDLATLRKEAKALLKKVKAAVRVANKASGFRGFLNAKGTELDTVSEMHTEIDDDDTRTCSSGERSEPTTTMADAMLEDAGSWMGASEASSAAADADANAGANAGGSSGEWDVVGQLWRRFRARLRATRFRPAVTKTVLVLVGQFLWVKFDLPGASGVTWYSAAMPPLVILLRPIFEAELPEEEATAKNMTPLQRTLTEMHKADPNSLNFVKAPYASKEKCS